MTGTISVRLRVCLVLLGFLAMGIPRCKSQSVCYQLRLETGPNPCRPKFPACPECSGDSIQVTNATVTVTSLDGNGGTYTSTVDATEAANSIVQCDTYTCRSLAFILLANYSTQYCFGAALGSAPPEYIQIDAVVSVEYTDIRPNPCGPTFPACPEGSGDSIQVTNATVTVNSDNGNGGTITSTVEATEAANSIVHCGDTYTCGSLAYILLANYSTQYCIAALETIDPTYFKIHAVVSVEYTGSSESSTFNPSFVGFFNHGKWEGPFPCTSLCVTTTTAELTQPPDGSTISDSGFPCNDKGTTSTVSTTDGPVTTSTNAPDTSTSHPTTADDTTSTSSDPTTVTTAGESYISTTTPVDKMGCGSAVSKKARVDLSSGNQQCGSTFTFQFGSVNDGNVTVNYAYTEWEDLPGGAESVELSDNADENNIVSIISSVIKIELIDGNTTINLSNGSVQIIFMVESTEGFPPTDGSNGVYCAYQVTDSVWSTDGVQVVSVDSDSVVCNSSHLTSFAVLLSLKDPTTDTLTGEHTTTTSVADATGCGSAVSKEAHGDLSFGNQHCGSTFTFKFGSVNDRNVTVHYAYTEREDFPGGAESVELSDNADENNIVSIISSVIKIELIDGNTTINLSNGSVQIIFMVESTEGFPPTYFYS
eukprot:XP_011664038.1 PREDICTED: mucin-5AC-like [Strongylocentrotus purpuratus]